MNQRKGAQDVYSLIGDTDLAGSGRVANVAL
jgi:hypothetical protein